MLKGKVVYNMNKHKKQTWSKQNFFSTALKNVQYYNYNTLTQSTPINGVMRENHVYGASATLGRTFIVAGLFSHFPTIVCINVKCLQVALTNISLVKTLLIWLKCGILNRVVYVSYCFKKEIWCFVIILKFLYF